MKKFISLALALAFTVACMFTLASCGTVASKKVKVIDIKLTDEEYAIGVDKNQPELLIAVNEFLTEIKEDGTLDEIINKYYVGGTLTGVTSAALDTSKDQLVVATNAGFEPFEYKDGDTYYGIDMELASLLAEKLGLELVIQNMNFVSVCTSVGNGCDLAMAGLTINADREEILSFSDKYFNASQKLIVMEDDTTFDDCTTAADVEAILAAMTSDVKVGVQTGTTGNFYVGGDEDWGFTGFPVTCKGYDSGSLAVQDMINSNIKYVIIDDAPAAKIAAAMNEVN